MTLVVVLRHSIKTAVTCFKPTYKSILSNFCHLLDFTRDPEGGKQAHDKDNCSSVVIIVTSLVAVLSVAFLILGACFLSWRKKQRKDVRNATGARDQLDNQERSSLSPENVARGLGFSEEAEPCDMKRENQWRKTNQSSSQECGYAMLTPRAMMLPGDSSYASLVKSKQEDCISESPVAASPLLQHDDERHDQLPTYVNARSANYANV
ncbi:uncharacterized protein LOC110056386 isoform X2 [Orbicella faveolata]|uniref:uncharacterized protein LOC110056386 isoform X2 n=1 Tax=Orbicella faveolata TaxID=48498 RepID=UPI0009E53D8F|nr:uncharacterized protein LOC110056386 isoform X2 [Orbicella faveolata]